MLPWLGLVWLGSALLGPLLKRYSSELVCIRSLGLPIPEAGLVFHTGSASAGGQNLRELPSPLWPSREPKLRLVGLVRG